MTLILLFLLVVMFSPLIAIMLVMIGPLMIPASQKDVNKPVHHACTMPNSDEIRRMSDSAYPAAV